MEVAEFNKETVASVNFEEVNVISHHNKTDMAVEAETVEANKNLFITEPNNAMGAKITKEVDITITTETINTNGTEPNKKKIVVNVPDKESYENTQLINIPTIRIEIPGINMPRELNKRLAYDFIMTTQFNKVCCSLLVSHNIKIK